MMRQSVSQPGRVGPQSSAAAPTSDTASTENAPLDTTERLLRLHLAARADFLNAESDLAAIRTQVARIAAGQHDPLDVPPAAALSASPLAVAPRARKRSLAALLAGLTVGTAALAGTFVAMGGASQLDGVRALAGVAVGVVGEPGAEFAPGAAELRSPGGQTQLQSQPKTLVATVASTTGIAPVSPSAKLIGPSDSDPKQDPGELYAARFAKVAASERACLARAVYYEARGEAYEGQVAVAQVVLNRARSVKWPATICGVVNQGVERGEKCQFSFACFAHVEPSGPMWEQAQTIAEQAVAGHAWLREALDATYYHATNVAPVWRLGLVATGTIGSHIFYRDGLGLRAAIGAKAQPAISAHPAFAFVPAARHVVVARTTVAASASAPAAGPKPHAKPEERQASAQAQPVARKKTKDDGSDWSLHLFGQ